ncbi:MAG TPA: septation protein IspZ [Steroidobacteraceae bacterium]|jgi:intracellular septation protein|nr:septation protein IspZ [Steroidobacteraceae bacterium]
MQALIDLVPLVAFLAAYYLRGIYAATAVLMVAMVALLAVDWLRLRRIPPLHLASALLVLLLGGATLLLRDPRFLKWKPTVFLWLVAASALGSAWIGKTPLAQRLLQPLIEHSDALPRRLWLRLNWFWVLFCAALGCLNLAVADLASERAWVKFNVFGLSAAFIVFAMVQGAWLAARTEALNASAS